MDTAISPSLRLAALTGGVLLAVSSVHADVTLSPGLVLAEEGGTIAPDNLAASGTAIAFDLLGGGAFAPTHTIANVNNQTFGNASSWIGDSENSWIGVAWNSAQSVQSVAFGRDNTGQFLDRNQGLYTLQFTADAGALGDPGAASWTTIGTLDYGAGVGGTNFANPSLRHRYNFDMVSATGLRLITPGNGLGGPDVQPGTAIDEFEVYATPGTIVGPPPPFTITPMAGYTISWNGNDGANFDPNGPELGGAVVPDNLALTGTPITVNDLGPELSIPFHVAGNLNDGVYGNSNSWIGGANPPEPQHAGIVLDGQYFVNSFAFGRDNGNNTSDCCGGQATDRSTGLYTIQITENGMDWVTIGTIDYVASEDTEPGGGFTTFLRHEFEIGMEGGGDVVASGLRILVPATGIGGGTAIDEIEIYGSPVPEPGTALFLALGGAALTLVRRKRA